MYKLLIVGAGGFGRELMGWAAEAKDNQERVIAGFLDSNASALDGYSCNSTIVGDPDTYIPSPGDRFVCAIGDPATKLKMCRNLRARGAIFINLIHPTANVGPHNIVGDGLIMCANAGITTNVRVGDFVTINCVAGAGHDVVIGDGCTLSAHCDITGNAQLGEGVFLGSHAVILPGVKVGDFAKVGAGSVVLRNVRAGATVFGVPAKQIS